VQDILDEQRDAGERAVEGSAGSGHRLIWADRDQRVQISAVLDRTERPCDQIDWVQLTRRNRADQLRDSGGHGYSRAASAASP
jgi:hypothetical protein